MNLQKKKITLNQFFFNPVIQMRHYIMHFWQQLPSNIVIFIDQMKLLDSFMYSSLCRLYLSLDSDDKNLQHINTIGHVMYVWIKEIFNNNSNNMNKWKLIISNQYNLGYLNTIKLNDALKWKFKIKFIVNLIALLKVSFLFFKKIKF